MDTIEIVCIFGCGAVGGAAFCVTLWIISAISKIFERRK